MEFYYTPWISVFNSSLLTRWRVPNCLYDFLAYCNDYEELDAQAKTKLHQLLTDFGMRIEYADPATAKEMPHNEIAQDKRQAHDNIG